MVKRMLLNIADRTKTMRQFDLAEAADPGKQESPEEEHIDPMLRLVREKGRKLVGQSSLRWMRRQGHSQNLHFLLQGHSFTWSLVVGMVAASEL